MPMTRVHNNFMRLLLAPLLAGLMSLAFTFPARAQIVVMVNGSPVTALDIEQRTKFEQLTTHKARSRQEVINTLIDDRLKIYIAKRYGIETTPAEIDQALENMAKRSRATPQQMTQSLAQSGISINTLRAKIQADISWSQLVRGRYSASLQIGEADINSVLQSRGAGEGETVGYTYTLYPIVILVPRGSNASTIEVKRQSAENLRSRFVSCNEGLRLARALRDVAVREPVSRSSGDLAPQLRDLLNSMEIGRVTTPEVTEQGLQMFALCDKKQTKIDTAAKREVREEIFSKRFEERGKKLLDEVRRSAMIEYR